MRAWPGAIGGGTSPRTLVVLAHEMPFRLGALQVEPALRRVSTDRGDEEIVQPRTMQVLVALARADGAIVTRDDLTISCWSGTVVSDDSINRVIAQLRRLAAGIGAERFMLETVTKVGYRLMQAAPAAASEGVATGPAPQKISDAKAGEPSVEPTRLSRRGLLLMGGGVAAFAATGGLWLIEGRRSRTPSPEVAALLRQATQAAGQGTGEGFVEALNLRKRATEIAPDYADAWGALALSYSAELLDRPKEESDVRARTSEAIARAKALDPTNAYARLAEARLEPTFGNWRSLEITLRSNEAAGGERLPFICTQRSHGRSRAVPRSGAVERSDLASRDDGPQWCL